MQWSLINPATGETFQQVEATGASAVTQQLDQAQAAQRQWAACTAAQRAACLVDLGQQLMGLKQQAAEAITLSMGKPITQSLAEIDKCIGLCNYYADHGPSWLESYTVDVPGVEKAWVELSPLGVVFAVMPWNFPFWQVFRVLVPVLMGGNGFVFKHAPNTFNCAALIADLFKQIHHVPEGLVQSLVIDVDQVPACIAHPGVQGVSLTGGQQAGRAVAALAGQYGKKSVLELGGNDPYIVLEDADLDLAARVITQSRMNNNGQVCIAAKRCICIQKHVAALTERILALMQAYHFGNPASVQCVQGPMARADLRVTLHRQVQESIKSGAKSVLGGVMPQGIGYYYPATLLTEVTPGMPAFDQELFGPVLSIIAASDVQESIALANHSDYGLAAAVFTRNLDCAAQVIKALQVGNCAVNAQVRSQFMLPFGGLKCSGYGSELAQEGMLGWLNLKSCCQLSG